MSTELQKSKNIKFCAYLRLMGISPVEVIKFERGKAEYAYKMSSGDWHKYQVQFNQSKFLEYAQHLEGIKDLAF
jgi:hypothetical protein